MRTLPPIDLAYDAIKAETVTAGGVTLTVEQLCGFIAAYFDQKASS